MFYLRTIQTTITETSNHFMGYSFWLAAWDLLYAPLHKNNSTSLEHWLEQEIAQCLIGENLKTLFCGYL